jgi:hypothetical protein
MNLCLTNCFSFRPEDWDLLGKERDRREKKEAKNHPGPAEEVLIFLPWAAETLWDPESDNLTLV